MKARALLYIIGTPLFYLYGLAENHFSFGKALRVYTLDFSYEYLNGWRILFGKEYKDYSIKVGIYEFKLKAKKSKFDLEVAMEMKKLYGTWNVSFNKKKKGIINYYWSGSYGDAHLEIKQIGKDEFKVKYYNDSGWNKKRSLHTDYIFTKEEVISMIRLIKEKN